jgi:hypothetical protein
LNRLHLRLKSSLLPSKESASRNQTKFWFDARPQAF